ncbi:hypothetical protein RchiOBHm_Chr1g0354131 [Rosa chinensis]|uniref:Uncharacterized protein n=1 Tax=Rosa chinensis TaxID=74649 RepID=A0A2P6SH24_ROSCH|nr:hypothetical protein RchiOBHm_Chr1g0354131 [Rosa chinensis]
MFRGISLENLLLAKLRFIRTGQSGMEPTKLLLFKYTNCRGEFMELGSSPLNWLSESSNHVRRGEILQNQSDTFFGKVQTNTSTYIMIIFQIDAGLYTQSIHISSN